MNIIITGASRGIGKETALLLAKDTGNSILAISRSEDALNKLKGEAANGNISIFAGDIVTLTRNPRQLKEIIDTNFNRVDILINNAGKVIPKPFRELSDQEDEMVIETNFTAPMRLIRQVIPYMRRGSHVINIGSMGGVQGSSKYPGLAVYSAAKAAIAVLTESLSTEYIQTGINFNCLSFGAVQTEMLEEAFPGFKAPISAAGMAEFLAWFALNGNKYFNGKVLPVSVANP
jgi:3-oxoacyl-[acyl-carrier protein] reductase